jgi:serine/threonine-protein kinase
METIRLPTGTFEYDPNSRLGKPGGFGEVFLGKSSNGEEVAVKKLKLSAADAAHRELRIADEMKGRSFEHVVPFIDSGEDTDTGRYFVVMPKAEGNLDSMLIKNGPVAPTLAASVLLQIVNGLIEVGELVHRDLKPDNILLHEGKWKIADFGIARFVDQATASDTLKECLSRYYAAPEQWRGERATHATDVYALGCIAFCLLTGAPPFTNDPKAEHQKAAVPTFSCSEPRLTTLINVCLRKTASSRRSLSEVRSLLAAIGAKVQPPHGASSLGTLAAAAAYVSTIEQEAQARDAAARAAREARSALAKSGYEILADNVERLWGKIHSQAANAERLTVGRRDAFECQIGSGQLVINLSRSNVLEPGSFPQSGWDVVAFSEIVVNQRQPHYCWSASLWFTKLRGQIDYRWHEASYFSWKGHEFEPHAERPGENADFAASNILHSVNFAFGPIAVDDDREDDFHERWIWLLSRAAVGQLRRPSQMPFGWPPTLS